MIYKSSDEEVHRIFPQMKIPAHEGIYKMDNGTDKVAFVILPVNGGRPVHLTNGYPKADFDREYVDILSRYYRYPPMSIDELIDIESEVNPTYKSITSRMYEADSRMRRRWVINNTILSIVVTVIVLIVLFMLALAGTAFIWLLVGFGIYILSIILIWVCSIGLMK